jgi:GTP-binding protein YchF
VQRVGILGLPGAGKTTLFEILMQGAGVPQGKGRENLGVVSVPDERLDKLSALYQPKKTTPTRIEFVDSAAAGQGGRGKGDVFASTRNCDALLAVVRDFDNPAVPAAGGVDPERDRSSIETELAIADLVIVETRLEKIEKERRIGKGAHEREHEVLARCRVGLEAGKPLRAEVFDAEDEKVLRGFQLMSKKPLLVVYNQDDAHAHDLPDPGPGALAAALKASMEREIVALPPEERAAYRAELGVGEDGLGLIIRKCYELLGLISFFTVGPDEVRAWTLRRGDKAVDAAAEIHTDLAKGFVRAETVEWQVLVEQGGTAGARAIGALRLEGRDYVVKDGDCMEIRFTR